MAAKKDSKTIYSGNQKCPFCGKIMTLKLERKVITPAVSAETEIKVSVDKSTQKTLKDV